MPIPFTLRQLEYFISVVEHGSVTAAAAARHVSQPSISVAISDLEEVIGQKLFLRRAGQRLAISEAGRRLLLRARSMLAQAADIAGEDGRWLESNRLSISCFRDIGPMYLPRLLTRFAKTNPGVEYRMIEGDLAEIRAQLLDGRSEIAITYATGLAGSEIELEPIDALEPYAMMAEAHPLVDQGTIPLEALRGERVIIEDFPITLDYFLGIFRAHQIEPDNVQKVSSFEMQRGLVASGWGVGLSCVRPMSDHSYDGSVLVCRPLATREDSQKIVVAHLGLETLSGVARRFRQSVLAAAPA
ncbi:DNA-binding transcriptional LysR family regulator [Hoeflea marina]|uniref:DNA-binding transcriptional LysR family regulator n=1 Tax=Hoeflea marina TaxID=274592 RepID=A0A317PCR1_9HYPH|nr:LysR substrate-binding domain-containing protein [Hoeflea marina]PWV95620.1 DNA-binding transcriptional LysR family regulator [Hoeflea marina]